MRAARGEGGIVADGGAVLAGPRDHLAGRGAVARRLGVALAGLALLLAHRSVAMTPIDVANPLTPLARLADIALIGLVLALAHAVGRRVLRALRVDIPGAQGAAASLALGLGALAYALLALGQIGLYRPLPNLLLCGALALLVRRDLGATLEGLRAAAWQLPRALRGEGRLPRALAVLTGGGVFLALLGALTPAHHYDPLTYHLTLPRAYLLSGRIGEPAGLVGADLPLTVEVLNGLGLGWGSEAFGQLLHLAFAGIACLALWGLARRWTDRAGAWLAVAIFLGTPLVPVWSRVADNDLAVGCFLTIAVAVALGARGQAEWSSRWRWLAVAGSCAGLALGTKYQAVFGIVPLALIALLAGWSADGGARPTRARLGLALGGAAAFGVAAAAVAAPWYLRNVPALLGYANALLTHQSAGGGATEAGGNIHAYLIQGLTISPRTPLGYLLLPFRAFARGDFEQRFVVPNPLFLLLPAVLLVPRLRRQRGLLLTLLVALVFLAGWSLGVQELRYILAVCPLLALGTACLLRAAWGRRPLRPLVGAGLVCSALLTLTLTFLHVGADRPLAVSLGLESRDAYLRNSVTFGATYRATSYLAEYLAPGDQALFVNELQIYYLPPGMRVLSSGARDVMFSLIERYPTNEERIAALQAERTTYILVNEGDLRWWFQADTSGRLARGKADFDRFTAALERAYQIGPDDRLNIVIYRVPGGATAGKGN